MTTETGLSTLVGNDDEEEEKSYPIKRPDLNLRDQNLEKVEYHLNDKMLRPVDRAEAINTTLCALLGIGEAGEKLQNMEEGDQNNLMAQMLYAPNLPAMNEVLAVGLELKPAAPAMPSGPQFGYVPLGPGMGGGMGMAPRPPAPPGAGAMPPQMPPAGYPPQQHGYPQQPPGYAPPPYGDPHAQPGYGGYAQPHPYPSYPAQQQPGYGYPPHGQPGHPAYPPQGYYPPPPPVWPAQQSPVTVVEAEVVPPSQESEQDQSDNK